MGRCMSRLLQKFASLLLPLPIRAAAEIRHRSFMQRDPLLAQRKLLKELLIKGSETKFGIDYGFSEMIGLPFEEMLERYRSNVPLRTYSDFWTDYFSPHLYDNGIEKRLLLNNITWPGKIPYFCESSGTTAPTKFIPFSKEMFAANRMAALDLVSGYLANRPKSRIAGGKFLYMAGSTALSSMGSGVYSGDMSAITLKDRPAFLNPFVEPSEQISRAPWDARLDGMAKLLLKDDRIRTVSGVPPWLIMLFRRCEELSGVAAQDILSHIELVIHGGTSMAPYYDEFQRLFPRRSPEFLEVLPSSEAFMGFQMYGEPVMRLTPWYGAFFEFVPLEQLDDRGTPSPDAETIPLEEVEPGQRYAVILSTSSGLWRYHIGDTLRFLDNEQYRIEFTGRDRFLDRFEEKVTQIEVESAVEGLNRLMGGGVREFMVGPDIANRRHLWVLACVERKEALQNPEQFLDSFLMNSNADYAAFRQQGRINPPSVVIGDEGLIYRWSKETRGKLGGQSKIPHIDPTLTGDMVRCLNKYAEASC